MIEDIRAKVVARRTYSRPKEDGTFVISTDNKIYTMDEIEAKIRKNCYLD